MRSALHDAALSTRVVLTIQRSVRALLRAKLASYVKMCTGGRCCRSHLRLLCNKRSVCLY